MRSEQFIEGVLENQPLFREAGPEHRTALARSCVTLSARRGDLLARQGERVPGMFIVGYGLAKLALRRPPANRVLRLVAAGESFGAAAALLGRAAPYEAVALNDSKLLVVPAAAILQLVEREPRFARTLVTLLAERALELLAEVEAASLQGGAQRLAAYLTSLVDAGELAVRLPMSKTLVAARLGMKKETLSRLLARFAAEGLIEPTRREITIRDRERLARLGSAG